MLLSLRKNRNTFIYTSREERAKYTTLKYQKYLKRKILDVGCGDAHLKELISHEYVGIDLAGRPDVIYDLEKGKLPFKNNSFDCVVCTDVLEHLENIHDMFFELARVTRKYVIISLPNNWNPFIKSIFRGESVSKFYGLPVEKQRDRHKWFFNYEEAKNFIRGMAEKTGMDVIICEQYCHFGVKRPFINFSAKMIFSEARHNNIFALALWTVLER